MARQHKIVDEYRSTKYDITIPIRLDKENGKFLAYYADIHYSETALTSLKAQLFKAIIANNEATWTPVIHIQALMDYAPSTTDARAGVRFYRFYLSKQGQLWYRVSWDEKQRQDADSSRPDIGQFQKQFYERAWSQAIPGDWEEYHFDDRFHNYIVPYDDTLWNGLTVLGSKIGELQGKIRNLVGTPQGQARLASFSIPLLEAPKNENPND